VKDEEWRVIGAEFCGRMHFLLPMSARHPLDLVLPSATSRLLREGTVAPFCACSLVNSY